MCLRAAPHAGAAHQAGKPTGAAPADRLPRVYSSAVEHRIADPAVAGSIPAAPLTNTFGFEFVFCPVWGRCVRIRVKRPVVTVPVAQLDKASDYESEDWGFESLQG